MNRRPVEFRLNLFCRQLQGPKIYLNRFKKKKKKKKERKRKKKKEKRKKEKKEKKKCDLVRLHVVHFGKHGIHTDSMAKRTTPSMHIPLI